MAQLQAVRRPTTIQKKNIFSCRVLTLGPGENTFYMGSLHRAMSGPLPEISVELPLLSGSLSLSEVVELQTNSDCKLEEGQGPKEPVAASYRSITVGRTHHTKLHRQTDRV